MFRELIVVIKKKIVIKPNILCLKNIKEADIKLSRVFNTKDSRSPEKFL